MSDIRAAWSRFACLIVGVVFPYLAPASPIGGEFLIFPAIQAENRINTAQRNSGGRYDSDIAANLFYSYDKDGLLSLVEFFLGRDEQELERFQLGFSAGEAIQIWFGRYHSPLADWNITYHHGRFLQPTITNPGIVDFEDGGGAIPTHLTGIMVSSEFFRGGRLYSVDAGLGLGPSLDQGTLNPLDLLRPQQGKQSLSGALRLNLESLTGEYKLGLSAGYAQIDRESPGHGRIQQSVVGAHGRWRWGRVALSGEGFAIHNRLHSNGRDRENTFFGGYLQGIYRLSEQFSPYLRLEDTWHNQNDAYLDQLAGFVDRKQLLGLRYDFTPQQALNLEYAHTHLAGEYFDDWWLQWSAVLP